MKHVVIFLLLGTVVLFSSCNNNKEVLDKLNSIENTIKTPTTSEPIYKVYPTRNMWNFLKLDTRNGKITIVQFSVKENDEQFEYSLSNVEQVKNNIPGRFILQPTDNFYNFIMLDQVSGQTYQVQWSFDENKRFVIPIM